MSVKGYPILFSTKPAVKTDEIQCRRRDLTDIIRKISLFFQDKHHEILLQRSFWKDGLVESKRRKILNKLGAQYG